MHATLVVCLHSPDGSLRKGFTLLELLVVMALMALAAGLVTPAVQRSLFAAKERAAAVEMTALLDSLPVRAFQQGSDLSVDEQMLRQWLPDLPEGWTIALPQRLQYSAHGVAKGGVVTMTAPRRQPMKWTVGTVNGLVVREVGLGGP